MPIGTIIVLLVFMVGLPAVFYFIYKKFSDKKIQEFLEKNPNAVKVYLGGLGMSGVYTVSVQIDSVDGEKAVTFIEGIKTGFYLNPGTHLVEATATKTRPWIMYKSVSTTYWPIKNEVEVEMHKTYSFGFDAKNETFTFGEKN